MRPSILILLILFLMTFNIRKVESILIDTYLVGTYQESYHKVNTEQEKIIVNQQKTIKYYQLYCLVSLIIFIFSDYIVYYYHRQKKNEPAIIAKKSHSSVTKKSKIEFERIYASIIRYVVTEKHYLDKEIDIEKVGESCHIKKGYVNKALNAEANITLLELVNNHRLKYACILLLDESNKTMDAVADESGFKTTRTFLRQFKSRYNMLPSEYRRSDSDICDKTI